MEAGFLASTWIYDQPTLAGSDEFAMNPGTFPENFSPT
jgi:hypothetical protein